MRKISSQVKEQLEKELKMKKNTLSLSRRIEEYLKKREGIFVHSGEIERLALAAGYKASNASRRLREMYEEGYLDRELRQGRRTKSVWYKWHDYL